MFWLICVVAIWIISIAICMSEKVNTKLKIVTISGLTIWFIVFWSAYLRW